MKNYTWTGEQANGTGGYYITVETEGELTEALQKALGCPMMTERPLARR